MNWTEEYQTGVDLIDRGHKNLHHNIEALYVSCRNDNCTKTLWEMVKYLEDYVSQDFSAEETLQQSSQYPDVKIHKALHSEFRLLYYAVKRHLERHVPSPTFMHYAKAKIDEWLTAHILMDRKFGDFLRQQNTETPIPHSPSGLLPTFASFL